MEGGAGVKVERGSRDGEGSRDRRGQELKGEAEIEKQG